MIPPPPPPPPPAHVGVVPACVRSKPQIELHRADRRRNKTSLFLWGYTVEWMEWLAGREEGLRGEDTHMKERHGRTVLGDFWLLAGCRDQGERRERHRDWDVGMGGGRGALHVSGSSQSNSRRKCHSLSLSLSLSLSFIFFASSNTPSLSLSGVKASSSLPWPRGSEAATAKRLN